MKVDISLAILIVKTYMRVKKDAFLLSDKKR